MLTGALVVVAPRLSLARAVKVWLPEGTFFQVYEYGEEVSRTSTVVPSRISTAVTVPSGSEAPAEIVMVGFQANVAPSAGELMLTTGAAFAPATVMVTGVLVAV